MENNKDINYYIKNIYDVNLYTAIKYLCGLACITDNCKSYVFKREQLLMIYKMCCIKNNIDIWNYDNCVELILKENGRLGLKNYDWIDCYYTVKVGEKIFDINKRIEDDLSDISKVYPIYRIDEYETFSVESKELLTEIFREFGGYDVKIIADWLKQIVIYSSKNNSNNITDNLTVFLQDKNNEIKMNSNKIFSFINNYNFNIKDNNLEFNIDKVCSEFKRIFLSMSYEEQKKLLEKIELIDKNVKFIEEEKNYSKVKARKKNQY